MRPVSVVKLGGALLAWPDVLAAATSRLAALAVGEPLVVVPGGGVFADAVRAVDRRLVVGDSTAHWMAILAMDQYAHLLAARMPGAALVDAREAIAPALDAGRVPVLAPYRWLRAADPLPHSWRVTSDSIAAWVAGQLGARRLLLVKPPAATGDLVDPELTATLPDGVACEIVTADRLDQLAHVR